MFKKALMVGTGLAAALTLAACSNGTPSSSSTSEADFAVVSDVALEGSPTFEAMTKRDGVIIGVKEDQPNLGYLDAATGERSGFDVEIATWLAASLGFSADQIEFKAIPSVSRESAIVNGDIDYYVGTYSITDARKQQVDFAGPYFVTGQGLLVAADNTTIKSESDLAGQRVCSATGSTPIQNIKTNFPDTKTVEFDTYSQCVEALNDGQVDAITTDEAILIGYAAQDPENLKVVGSPFTVEEYGIGLKKGDDVLRAYINETLTEGGDTWTAIYNNTLGESGTKVEQPQVNAY
ncbi:glutamate ABC transporter substrate-binding protein [Lysinibacter sp. HNR]|uniref:glutamate ABC transporter substrate-binding protein n=1 Tax=Lysinibacter sp. HNR TaxID=3031408 RepID=UPI00243534CA|nr:glutamate ABC transporter substrate-binding protein [Lysinibacter sp. HNR]WGD38385.1 glutamate ABC transporter substrate-binding protein [Lysinibacter sp. HNR]